MKLALSMLTVLLWSGAARAYVGLEEAANWARSQGCAISAGQPLRSVASLRKAASQMASGSSLQSALSRVGYLASQSSVIHLSGMPSDAELRRILVANYCKTLTDPAFREFGAAAKGLDAWLVLGAPVALPAVRDAALIERQIVTLVNQARAAGRRCGGASYPPAPPLTLNAALTDAALTHAQEMAAYLEFEHRGHDGSTPAQRVSRAGYGAYKLVGENIAAGPTTAAEVTAGWLASPPHCQNIMDPRFSNMGVSFALNTASSELIYWSQDFATPGR